MYNLNFMEQIESGKGSLIRQRDLYMQIKTKILELQKEGKIIANQGRKINDKKSKEYLDLAKKLEKINKGINNLINDKSLVEKRFENIKQYIIKNLNENKDILEKYGDLSDNDYDKFSELTKLKEGLEDVEIDKEKLDNKINELEQKIGLNNLSKEQISKLNKDDRKKAIDAREQYLNNKKELEKNEEIKYILLLGDEEQDKRVAQCRSAIEYMNREFNIDNIEDVIGNLEEILDIQKQMPQIKFDVKTHKYTYINERGKENEYEMFEKGKSGKYISGASKEYIEDVRDWAEDNGLSKKQMKAIDYNIVNILEQENPYLLKNYLEAVKGQIDPEFNVEYNFKTKGMNKQDRMDRKTLKTIKKSANKQKSKGIATVIKNKIKGRVVGLLAALGLAGGTATAAIAAQEANFTLDKEPMTVSTIGETLGKDRINNIKDKLKEEKDKQNRDNKKEENDKQDKDNKKQEKQVTVGDYIKISDGAMLFKNPTDELRIMNGMNATEKIKIKQSSKDKLYKINKEGYYSLDGDCIEFGAGQSLDEVLKSKGLDKSYIENGDFVKMYHAVADGISQWVKAEDVEKVEIRTDKLGNPIDKTEEEKKIDDDMIYQNAIKEANERYQMMMEALEEQREIEEEENQIDDDMAYQNSIEEANERHQMMMEALQEQREIEEELRSQKIEENEEER